MDINFALVLVLLVAFTGGVWLWDKLFFARKREIAFSKAKSVAISANKQSTVIMGTSPISGAATNAKQGARLSQSQTKGGKSSTAIHEPPLPVLVEYCKSFFPMLLLVLVVRSFLFEPFQIPSGSMIPTLEIGDFILVNKYDYGLRLPVVGTKILEVGEPQRGDVMVFFPPHEPNRHYIKRVVGLPGDRIEYRDKQIIINGEPVKQKFRRRYRSGMRAPDGQMTELDAVEFEEVLGKQRFNIQQIMGIGPNRGDGVWVIPDGHYFMMGDNRDNSSDSRAEMGFVPEELIVGRAFFVWMHWRDKLSSLPSFQRSGSIYQPMDGVDEEN